MTYLREKGVQEPVLWYFQSLVDSDGEQHFLWFSTSLPPCLSLHIDKVQARKFSLRHGHIASIEKFLQSYGSSFTLLCFRANTKNHVT